MGSCCGLGDLPKIKMSSEGSSSNVSQMLQGSWGPDSAAAAAGDAVTDGMEATQTVQGQHKMYY